MNPDFQDSAAWSSFGMLSADQSSALDDAVRKDPMLRQTSLETDRLCAAIAVAASRPVRPSPRNLERIRARLALPHKSRLPWWPAASGWAAAAVLALIMALQQPGLKSESKPAAAVVKPESNGDRAQWNHASATSDDAAPAIDSRDEETPGRSSQTAADAAGRIAYGETGMLTRRIALLHDQLKVHQERQRAFLRAVPGMAMPVIMKMSPPEARVDLHPELAKIAINDSPLQELFPSQSAATAGEAAGVVPGAPGAPETRDLDARPVPSAIPIYDVARDSGTIVLSNLPPAAEGREYNLWVRTKADAEPVRVGILPGAGTSPSESFDFSLGMAHVIPAGFILTQDPLNRASTPGAANTVLQGPHEPGP